MNRHPHRGLPALEYPGHAWSEACYSIFAYLHKHPTMSTMFHPSHIRMHEDQFRSHDWRDFYSDAKEELPPDMPEPLREPVKMMAFVNSDHAGNLVTRQSQTGYLIFCNQAPLSWFSKQQKWLRLLPSELSSSWHLPVWRLWKPCGSNSACLVSLWKVRPV